MINVSVSLGSSDIKRLARQMKRFQNRLKRTDFADEMLAEVTEDLRAEVGRIPDLDGNYDSTTIDYFEPLGLVSWRGSQITFLEFGTGAKGASQPYQGTMPADYSPDPTLYEWIYQDRKTMQAELSEGLTPQAPMYKTALKARRDLRNGNSPIHRKVREILNEVTTR